MNIYKDRYNKTHENTTCASGTYWNYVPSWRCDCCQFVSCEYHSKNRYHNFSKEFGVVASLGAELDDQNSNKKEMVTWQ